MENLSIEAVLELIATLPPHQAEVIVLRVVAGLDVGQVARITGRRPGAVRVAAHRGLRALAGRLSPQPEQAKREQTRRCNAVRAAGGSGGVMSIRSRLRARRSLDAVTAERLLAGRGVPGDAPAGQQALARALEIISGPGTGQELAGEVAAAAAFVQVASQAGPCRLAGRALVAVGCVIAVGGTAADGALSGSHKAAPVRFGVPASRLAVLAPRVTGTPEGEPQAHPKAAYQLSHPSIGPSVGLRRGGR